MKNLLKTAFCLSLAAVFLLGIGLVLAPEAQAGSTCPPCYVPPGASGWSQYGSCIGGPAHCPVAYRTYRNDYSGQICRDKFPFANI